MSNILHSLKEAFQQMGRNKGMTSASLFAITAMMLILGLFFSISVNVNLFTEIIRQDYNSVEIYLVDEATDDQIQKIEQDVAKIDGVTNVKFRTKDEAMDIMRERWGESAYLLDSLDENPLPNSVVVTVRDVKAADAVNKYATEAKDAGVESTTYYKETVDKLTRVTRVLQIGIMIIMLFLIVVSVVIVSNTIRLTVFARAREISIEKYVGATNWFIRAPFLIQGILIGLVAAVISSLICYLIYAKVVDVLQIRVMTILSSPLVPADYLVKNLIIIFAALGVGIGACGSIFSMRRYLKA